MSYGSGRVTHPRRSTSATRQAPQHEHHSRSAPLGCRRRGAMPIQHAVLSLLVDGPGHGYELKGAFEHAVGPHWGPLNIGHLYQVLDRLSRDGLAVSHRVPQQVKPDRVVYEITSSGRAEW